MVVNALNSNVWTYMADFEGEKMNTLDARMHLLTIPQIRKPQHGTPKSPAR